MGKTNLYISLLKLSMVVSTTLGVGILTFVALTILGITSTYFLFWAFVVVVIMLILDMLATEIVIYLFNKGDS
ncbi:hypothetical protein [Liquorilactobacillus mali]|nr:hypothetical protein [Liquorilactobacillus mali]